MFGLTAIIAYTIKDLPISLGDKAFAFALNHFYDVQALSPKDLIELKRLSFIFQRALEKAETGKVIQALEQAKAREILPPDNLVKSDDLPPIFTTLQSPEQYNKLSVDFKTNEGQLIRLNLSITIEKDGSPVLHNFRSNEAIESIAVSKGPSDLVYYPKKGHLFEDPLRIICNIRLSRGPEITLLVAVNKNVLNVSRGCVVVDRFVKGQRHVPIERKGELSQYRGETTERHVHFRA